MPQGGRYVLEETFNVPPKHAPQRPGAVRDPFLKKEILNGIRPILEKKGYAEAASEDEADFPVVFYAMVRNDPASNFTAAVEKVLEKFPPSK